MKKINRQTLAPIALGLAAAALVAGCHGSTGTGAAGGASSADAAASSARALASSSAGAAAKTQAEAVADDCKPAAGFDALEPGVPGAAAARKTFDKCEKIPEAAVFNLGVCLVRAYTHAPAKGTQGSAAETARQTYLATAEGGCVQTAKGHKPAAAPTATPTTSKAAHPSPSPSGSKS
jgi:hypothetical protein